MEIEISTATDWDGCPPMSVGRALGVGVAATATAATSVLLMIVGFFYAFAQALGGGSVLIGFACIPVAWLGGLFALNYVVRGVLGAARVQPPDEIDDC